MDTEETRRSADALSEVLSKIDAGELHASESQRAYLSGALDTLNRLLDD